MFCGKCGAKNEDNAVFCAVCGAPFEASQPTPSTPDEPKAPMGNPLEKLGIKLDNRMIGIIAIAALALVVVIVGFMLFSGRGYEATVKELFTSVKKADAKAFLKLIPDGVIEDALEDSDMTKKEFTKEMQERLDDMIDSLEDYYGDDWDISYKIKDTDEVDEDDLEDLQDMYDDEFNVKVKDAMEVELKVTLKYDDEKETNEMTIILIKVGSSWYLDMSSLSGLF